MTATITPTSRPLHQRLLDLAREHIGLRASSLHGLDDRTLADIGVHPSEIGSIESESHGLVGLTRRRVVLAAQHV